MKVRIIHQPAGLLNGYPWPEAGEEIELPDVVGASMADAGHVEVVAEKAEDKAEKRPASKRGETRKD